MTGLLTLLAQATSAATGAPAVAAHSEIGGARLFLINLAYLAASACFIFGLKMLKAPKTARRGNMVAASGMVIAVLATLLHGNLSYGVIGAGLLVGAGIGATMALRVHMKGMPQMVSLFNGFGGLAAAMVGLGEYLHTLDAARGGHGLLPAWDVRFSVALSILIGMITFTGSLVAWAKLEEKKIKLPFLDPYRPIAISAPILLPYQRWIGLGCAALIVIFALTLGLRDQAIWAAIGLLLLAAIYGLLFVLPIGGADMPVVIALLNSFSGLGAAATGMVLHNNALIIGGSLVGASGLILTMIMCKAMNRSLANVLAGGFGTAASAEPGATTAAPSAGTIRKMDPEEAALVLDAAQN